MKKLIFSFGIILFLISCGGNSGEKKAEGDTPETKTETAETTDLSANPDYQKGLGLIAKSDCLTCHKIDEMLTGPSYRDVANKYAGMPDTIITHLAGKIINGGNGVWGETFMTPHSGITQEDAEAMVKYIMLLKK
jgi:cytochrome c